MIYRFIIPLFTLLSLLLSPAVGFARPDMTPLGPNIADKGSAWYRFTVNTVDSADGQRHYKVWTAVPRKPAPATGYAALYMLDGNAVMNHLSEALLQKLAAGNPPVLVAVGYQTPLPFDLAARTLDYPRRSRCRIVAAGQPAAAPPSASCWNRLSRRVPNSICRSMRSSVRCGATLTVGCLCWTAI
jgi:hypothetical protein